MIILGLDLALRRSGYAYLEGDDNAARLLARGVIFSKPTMSHNDALAHLRVAIGVLMNQTKPDIAYIEVPGMMNKVAHRSVQTVIALAEAKGIVIAECVIAGVAVQEITQSRVKAMVGTGDFASKEDVHRSLELLESAGRLNGYVTPHKPRGAVDTDLDDAVAIGVAGLRYERLRALGMVPPETAQPKRRGKRK